MKNPRLFVLFLLVGAIALFTTPRAAGAQVLTPDNGAGTANLPVINAPYKNVDGQLHIINGLPPGTTIDITAAVKPIAYTAPTVLPQGAAAIDSFFDVFTDLALDGTGTMLGYHRNLAIPGGTGSMHWGTRTIPSPIQNIDTDWLGLQTQLPAGDPDFDLLRITAGSSFGLPSPGHTTLTQAGANWAVDSFFDITYRIDFVGHPGGPLGGMSGSTTGTIRMALNTPEPGALSMLALGSVALLRRRRRMS